VIDQRRFLVRLELHLKHYFVAFVLPEQHPAGCGLVRDLLHHAQAPLRRFHFQNKGAGWHGRWIGLLAGVGLDLDCWVWIWIAGFHGFGLSWVGLGWVGLLAFTFDFNFFLIRPSIYRHQD